MSGEFTPGMIQTIIRAAKAVQEAAIALPPLVERIAVALEANERAEAARVAPMRGAFSAALERDRGRIVRTYECDGTIDQDMLCSQCRAPLGSRHDAGCPYTLPGAR